MSGAAWLFRQQTLAWLGDEALRRQLPPAYRLFALYCRAQRRISRSRVVGGSAAWRLAARLSATGPGRDVVALRIGRRTIHLDLSDPRMLDVPNELAGGPLARELAARLRSGDTFVDIGANHGSFAQLAAEQVGGEGLVVACEPQARLANLIDRTLAANGCSPYRIFAVACGDRDEEAVLFVPEASSGHAGLHAAFSGSSAHRRIVVPVRRIDGLFDWRLAPGGLLVKIDIEGSELAFFAGAEALIRQRAPRLLLEVNGDSLAVAGRSVSELRERLAALGYADYCELDEPLRPQPLARLDAERQRDIFLPAPAARSA
jgi:FkbM family methyltransferase